MNKYLTNFLFLVPCLLVAMILIKKSGVLEPAISGSKIKPIPKPKILMQKAISKTQKLLVYRCELTPEENQQRTQKILDKGNVVPHELYDCIFQLESTNGKVQRQLWKLKVKDYSSKEAIFGTDFKLFDADYDTKSQILVVAYEANQSLAAGLISTSKKKLWSGEDTTGAYLYEGTDDISLASATLHGSVSQANLSLTLRNYGGRKVKYLWKQNKWVKEATLLTGAALRAAQLRGFKLPEPHN